MKYGLIEEVFDLGAYIFGTNKVPLIPYQEDGNWEPYLPQYENQTTKLGQETSGCTVWGSQNCIETFYKKVYKEEPNYSERFTYINAGIKPETGANPHTTMEAIRKYGLVRENDMPMTDSIEEYMQGMSPTLLFKGKNWLETHEFKHEWVWDSKPENWKELLKESLKTSPLGVSVTAWRQENGLYVSGNGGNNHWCMLYKIDDDGVMWVFDSYDHSKKPLHPDHNIRRAKRIWVNKITQKASQKHVNLLSKILKMFMPKTLMEIAEENIGKDVTPKDEVPDEVACAETVSTILRMKYSDFPMIVSTSTMDKALRSNLSNWVMVYEPQAGDLIISPTEGKKIGHVGIVMENNLVASNNSFGVNAGKFTKNYTIQKWNDYYKGKGLEVNYYRRI